MPDPHMSLFLQEERELYPFSVTDALVAMGFKVVVRPRGVFAKNGKQLVLLGSFTEKIRRRLYRTEKTCTFCHNRVRLDGTTSLDRATIDHLQPLSQGGTWKRYNIRIACYSCNSAKSDLTEDEFRELIALHGARAVKQPARALARVKHKVRLSEEIPNNGAGRLIRQLRKQRSELNRPLI